MDKIEEYTDKEWEELASLLSDEKSENKDLLSRFMTDDGHNTVKQWKELHDMNNQMEVDVDKAWNKVSCRISESKAEPVLARRKKNFIRSPLLRIAATVLIITGLGVALFYLNNSGAFTGKIKVVTDNNQMNRQVKLPDGSIIFLNRNTKLIYKSGHKKYDRHVSLSGEAFFEITPDLSKPFTVETGKATVKVIGTSFDVITKNNDSSVEVFVKTGKVMLADSSGSQNIVLDPGYIGTLDSKHSEKKLNTDPNYMSWNTGKLVYNRQKLGVVFRDLKRTYNIDIVTSDPDILNLPIDATFNKEPHETIIRIICTTFNLSYKKDGNIYHLAKK